MNTMKDQVNNCSADCGGTKNRRAACTKMAKLRTLHWSLLNDDVFLGLCSKPAVVAQQRRVDGFFFNNTHTLLAGLLLERFKAQTPPIPTMHTDINEGNDMYTKCTCRDASAREHQTLQRALCSHAAPPASDWAISYFLPSICASASSSLPLLIFSLFSHREAREWISWKSLFFGRGKTLPYRWRHVCSTGRDQLRGCMASQNNSSKAS